jgi:hypothetical protein
VRWSSLTTMTPLAPIVSICSRGTKCRMASPQVAVNKQKLQNERIQNENKLINK